MAINIYQYNICLQKVFSKRQTKIISLKFPKIKDILTKYFYKDLYQKPIKKMSENPLKPEIPKSTVTAKLTLPNGKEVGIPILYPTQGDPMLDVRNLQALTGMFTFDPGYTVTGACTSKITYIDGKNGELYYRGYNIKDLVSNCKFVEVIY